MVISRISRGFTPGAELRHQYRSMPTTALSSLSALLERLGIRWVLIGAHAANRYRAATRLTHDIDLLLADSGGATRLRTALEVDGWQVRQADSVGELLRIRHPTLGVADVLIAGTDYQQEAIRRARRELIDDLTNVPVLTIEDVILHKLIAGRFQDMADVEAILVTRPHLDRGYLAAWFSYWSLNEEWQRIARDQA